MSGIRRDWKWTKLAEEGVCENFYDDINVETVEYGRGIMRLFIELHLAGGWRLLQLFPIWDRSDQCFTNAYPKETSGLNVAVHGIQRTSPWLLAWSVHRNI